MPLAPEEVLAIALMGFSSIGDPMNMATCGFILDPALYITVPPPPPPPPPSPVIGGGGGYTSAGNIAARPGNWTNVRPLWDFVDQQTFQATAKGVIIIRGKASVVVLPKTDNTLALPWDQLRIEDEMLLGVINTENTNELVTALETLDNMILQQDDLLLLLNGAYENMIVDDEDVILFC